MIISNGKWGRVVWLTCKFPTPTSDPSKKVDLFYVDHMSSILYYKNAQGPEGSHKIEILCWRRDKE